MTSVILRPRRLGLAAILGWSAAAAVLGQVGDDPSCPLNQDGKDGLCSRATAAEALWTSPSIGNTGDFKTIVEQVSEQDLTWFFSQWVYGGGGPSYRYGWKQVGLGGRYYVRCYVNQCQQESTPNYPLFRMPIDLTITSTTGSVTHTVWNDQTRQWYLLPADGPVTQVDLDKDDWILRDGVQVVGYVEPQVQCLRLSPDADGDGDADLDDFALYQNCLTGSGVYLTEEERPRCHCLDLDEDRDVDAADLRILRDCLSGQGVTLPPDCTPPF
ncbi:MAG: hypothetical protein KA354_15010 [Phycisphaerae bacterium]|nr:hypothetical protein [Phycisphaerae bacterium]